jgi:hypothetical protein
MPNLAEGAALFRATTPASAASSAWAGALLTRTGSGLGRSDAADQLRIGRETRISGIEYRRLEHRLRHQDPVEGVAMKKREFGDKSGRLRIDRQFLKPGVECAAGDFAWTRWTRSWRRRGFKRSALTTVRRRSMCGLRL